jgi:hypothetical protein
MTLTEEEKHMYRIGEGWRVIAKKKKESPCETYTNRSTVKMEFW